MKKRFLKHLVFLIILFLIITIMAYKETSKNSKENSLVTKDGLTLSYDYHYVSPKGIILVHMLNRDKSDYTSLTKKLNIEGFSTIAIDLRGHGKSQGKLENFEDKDYQNMVNDISAAKEFLESKGIKEFSIIGASIGANLALNYTIQNPNIKINKLVLLSPGENYHNVQTLEQIKRFYAPVLLAASKDDSYSYSSIQKLSELHKGETKIISFEKGGHGTFMFLTHPELEDSITEFIKK